VPADDVTTYRYNFTTQPPANPRGLGGPLFFSYEKYPFEMLPPTGVVPRTYTRENDYRIDRVAQKGVSYSGIADFRSQDAMATETAGPIYDRTAEHLGSTDIALIRMHRLLLRAAKALADDPAASLPALGGPGAGDFRAIRGAEKILADGEDWRLLGTDADPTVAEALMLNAAPDPSREGGARRSAGPGG
jgi:phthalate 4,5-dioxygenase